MADLLKQALLEAKEVRRSAYATAKLRLEEEFQPTLQRMVTRKLAEEDDEFGEENPELDIDIEFGAADQQEPDGDEFSEDPTMDTGDDAEGDDTGFGSFDDAEGGEDEEDEFESLKRELDGLDDEDEMMEGEDDGQGDWQDPIGEGYEEDDEELTEAEVNALYKALREEDGLGELDGSEDDGGNAFDEDAPGRNMNFENRRLKKENRRLKSELNEAFRVVSSLKNTINKVNLLNAKLQFTTHALRKGELSEKQQIKVMESIDRAKNVREVKLIYAAIVESLGKRKPKRISEGYSSKTTKVAKPLLRESIDPVKKKMMQLANIIPPDDY